MRLDLYLVEKKLATSRTQAQELIKNGYVFMVKNGQEVFLTKSNFDISEICANSLFIKQNDLHKFVSRGGLKLEAALEHLKLDVENMQVF